MKVSFGDSYEIGFARPIAARNGPGRGLERLSYEVAQYNKVTFNQQYQSRLKHIKIASITAETHV